MKVFNLIPGQPAYTLVGRDPASTAPGNLSSYYFGPDKLYDLDLSNKALSGEVIADIVEAFKLANATVFLRSLNISFNNITRSSEIERILAALPSEIMNLDMTDGGNYSASSFLRLRYLTGLQNLNVSGNSLNPGNNKVMGQVLQNLFHLRALTLGLNTNMTQVVQALKPSLTFVNLTFSDLSNDEDQISFGKALQNLTLHQLYLGNTQIGNSLQGSIALAQGLMAQTILESLDLSNNNIKHYHFLNFLPSSLTYLNVQENQIYGEEAFATAVKNMTKLTVFKACDNCLGCASDFLKVLQGKRYLSILDLSNNGLCNITQVRDLLQTTPTLKSLDLSANSLTNGSILAPVLSNLRNLTQLYLENNIFTPKDRLQIWNATQSFLLKSPFFLDDDLNYTTAYLQSFSPNTTILNLASLVQQNSTTFERIMPIIVGRFTNLRVLDLSNNLIADYDQNTNKTCTRGIEALIKYLPQLSQLQSLKISGSTGPSFSSELDPYYKNFSYAIGQLPTLRHLGLSFSGFVYADYLGKGLEESHSLRSVDFSFCWGDNLAIHWQGGTQLIKGLQAHPYLTRLDLSNNPIGGQTFSSLYSFDPNSTYALANALSSWSQLQYLNLGNDFIGYEDRSSSSYFLTKLAEAATAIKNKTGQSLQVNLLNGIYNVEWTNESHVFQNLTQSQIFKTCARELCTGRKPNTTLATTKNPQSPFSKAIEWSTPSHPHYPHKHKKLARKMQGLSKDPSSEQLIESNEFQEQPGETRILLGEKKEDPIKTEELQPHSLNQRLVSSSGSRLVPFYQPLVNSVKSWFSLKSWSAWGDRVLDSMANGILNYSQQVVENAPGYFPGTLDKSKSPAEGRNKTFRNYPIPHFRAIDQGEPLDIQRFNHMQALPQSQGFNHTSLPLMLTSGYQPLMLPN